MDCSMDWHGLLRCAVVTRAFFIILTRSEIRRTCPTMQTAQQVLMQQHNKC